MSEVFDSAYWHERYDHQALQSVENASGRSGYGAHRVHLLVEDAANALELRPHDSLLDIGCAAGLMGETLATIVGRYVGLDYSANAVASFRHRCPERDIRLGSATDLSQFKDGEFSKTLLSSVILLMSKDEACIALREMRRVTADGGRGMCSGNLELKPGMAKPNQNACKPGCRCYSQCLWVSYEELDEMAKGAGWARTEYKKLPYELPQFSYQCDVVLFT